MCVILDTGSKLDGRVWTLNHSNLSIALLEAIWYLNSNSLSNNKVKYNNNVMHKYNNNVMPKYNEW